jgi:hypothetical protein
VVIALPAVNPIKTLEFPVVIAAPASTPTPVLELPVELELKNHIQVLYYMPPQDLHLLIHTL